MTLTTRSNRFGSITESPIGSTQGDLKRKRRFVCNEMQRNSMIRSTDSNEGVDEQHRDTTQNARRKMPQSFSNEHHQQADNGSCAETGTKKMKASKPQEEHAALAAAAPAVEAAPDVLTPQFSSELRGSSEILRRRQQGALDATMLQQLKRHQQQQGAIIRPVFSPTAAATFSTPIRTDRRPVITQVEALLTMQQLDQRHRIIEQQLDQHRRQNQLDPQAQGNQHEYGTYPRATNQLNYPALESTAFRSYDKPLSSRSSAPHYINNNSLPYPAIMQLDRRQRAMPAEHTTIAPVVTSSAAVAAASVAAVAADGFAGRMLGLQQQDRPPPSTRFSPQVAQLLLRPLQEARIQQQQQQFQQVTFNDCPLLLSRNLQQRYLLQQLGGGGGEISQYQLHHQGFDHSFASLLDQQRGFPDQERHNSLQASPLPPLAESTFPVAKNAATAAAAAAAVQPPQQPYLTLPALLADPEDIGKLSDHQILLRQQIEAFTATSSDCLTYTRGRNKPISVGQVGLRCRHCAANANANSCNTANANQHARQKGSSYFPSTLMGLYQAAQNMSTTHIQCGRCTFMPESVKQEFAGIMAARFCGSGDTTNNNTATNTNSSSNTKKPNASSSSSTSGAGRPYWAASAKKQLGLVDTTDGGIYVIGNLPVGVAVEQQYNGPAGAAANHAGVAAAASVGERGSRR